LAARTQRFIPLRGPSGATRFKQRIFADAHQVFMFEDAGLRRQQETFGNKCAGLVIASAGHVLENLLQHELESNLEAIAYLHGLTPQENAGIGKMKYRNWGSEAWIALK
jgi:hypothetical protein